MSISRGATVEQLVTWFRRRRWPPSELIAQADGSTQSRSISGIYEEAGLVEKRRNGTHVATPKLRRVAQAFARGQDPRLVNGRLVR